MSAASQTDSSTILSVERLTMRFGGLTAVDEVSFAAQRGHITALIGPNGAGKTTVFNCITGFYKPTTGSIVLRRSNGIEHKLDRMADYRINRTAGVARTFQNIRLFAGMTCLENLLVAQHVRLMRASGFSVAGLLGLASWRKAEADGIEKATTWLTRTRLLERADHAAGDLSYGEQRRLEIARALCTDPEFLCLDEPAAGLNPRESAELNDTAQQPARRASAVDPAHRARHGRRHAGFRPHRGARSRRARSPKATRTRCGLTRTSSRPISASRTTRSTPPPAEVAR